MSQTQSAVSTGDRQVSGAEAIADLKEATRQAAGKKSPMKVRGPEPGSGGPANPTHSQLDRAFARGSHLVDTDITHDDVLNSEKWLKETYNAGGAFAQRLQVRLAKDYVFYLRCKQKHHQGIHFLVNPVDRHIGPDDWVSSYRRAGEAWMNVPVCQECLHVGLTMPLPVVWIDRNKLVFRVERRHLWMIARNPDLFAKEGGPIRMADLATGASNIERTKAEETRIAEEVA